MGILEIKNVNKRFGGLQALGNVNLNVEEGTVHAIIGPNGAGKSTLLNCLVGKLLPDTGTVTFEGQSILGLKPHQINQLGISRVFQTPEIFSTLSVFENVMIACFAKRDGSFRLNPLTSISGEKDIHDKVEQMLLDVNMADKRNDIAASMSRGDKRRLEMAMCLAQDPKLLLLDEPTAGMARADTNNTIDLLKEIEEKRGITMVIIEHDMHVVFSLANKITVLAQGTPIVEDVPSKIKGNAKSPGSISWRGARMTQITEENPNVASHAPVYFAAHELKAYYGESYIVQDVSLNVHEGEILALLGRNGAGKTSTLRAIARLDSPMLTHGEVWLGPSAAAHDARLRGRPVRCWPGCRKTGASFRVSVLRRTSSWPRSKSRLAGRSSVFTNCSRVSANAANRRGQHCQAANSRCWPSAVRWPAISSCCCLMSPMRVWHRLLCRKSRKPCT